MSLTNYQPGATIFSASLNTLAKTTDLVTDLRSFQGSAGMQVAVRGYRAAGDGGGGNWRWNATDTRADNSVTILQPTALSGAGRWNLLFDGVLRLRQAGAVEDGTTDDGPAFNLALAALGSNGGKIEVEPASILIATTVTVSAPVVIEGPTWAETPSSMGVYLIHGSTTTPMFFVQSPSGRGATFRNLALSQPQPSPVSGWTPTVYQPLFEIGASPGPGPAGQVVFDNLFFVPCYAGINAYLAGRLTIKGGLWGQFLGYALKIDKSYDVVHVYGPVHAWDYWSSSSYVTSWQQSNSDLFWLFRVDGFVAPDVFTIFHRSTLRLDQSSTDNAGNEGGITRFFSIGSLYTDQAKTPIWVTGSGNGTSYLPSGHINSWFANGYGPSSAPNVGGAAILVDTTGSCNLQIGQFVGEEFQNSIVSLTNASLQTVLRFGSFEGQNFNTQNNGSAAISSVSNSASPVSTTLSATQTIANYIPVTSATGIALEDLVVATGVPPDTYVAAISGSLIGLSQNTPSMLASGTAVAFIPPQNDIAIATEPRLLNANGAALLNSGTAALLTKPLAGQYEQTGAASGSYAISNSAPLYKIHGSTSLAGITVMLPQFPAPGYLQSIVSDVALMTFTVEAAVGQSIDNTITSGSLSAFTPLKFHWSATTQTWIREQ